ncbi:MAG: triose-phosphate isomerase [Candidatus Kapabacteria bacterium]|nr:triose-phosphate isomerase [Candidatus Kapabacteria bacterium]
MRKYLIAGNWKMYTTPPEATTLASAIAEKQQFLSPPSSVQTLICPPYTSIYAAVEAVKGSGVRVGAQDCHTENKGAFTGEIAPAMVKASGCSHVIVGHSERRQYFSETNALLNKKILAALNEGLVPIYCVGETLIERKQEQTIAVVRSQLVDGLKDVSLKSADQLVIAYEPVWAIGTGLAATSDQAQEVHAAIRGFLKEILGAHGAETLILYGGSLKPENAEEILAKPDVGGGLIGGASLQEDSFAAIIAMACKLAL